MYQETWKNVLTKRHDCTLRQVVFLFPTLIKEMPLQKKKKNGMPLEIYLSVKEMAP